MQVLTRVRGGCVVHRCQNKNPIERLTSGCEWRHAPEARAQRIWGILKKSVSWVDSCLGRRQLAFAWSPKPGQWPLWQVPHEMGVGADGKARIERMCISPYVEEPLNSKVIKSFASELRSRKCFSCFEIPMFYVYIYIYMNVLCPFRISVSGYGIYIYIVLKFKVLWTRISLVIYEILSISFSYTLYISNDIKNF